MSAATTQAIPNGVCRPRRWTTAEYDALLPRGLLKEGSKTFLWDGRIIEPMPETQPHANGQDNFQHIFMKLLAEEEWTINAAHPVALRDGYKPQPDLAILFGPRSNYRRHVASGADAALVVEIADSSYAHDFSDKLPEYARAGIPQYWIVNLLARRIEVYTDPVVAEGVSHYASRKDYSLEASIPLILSRAGEAREFGQVAVADVFRDS